MEMPDFTPAQRQALLWLQPGGWARLPTRAAQSDFDALWREGVLEMHYKFGANGKRIYRLTPEGERIRAELTRQDT